MSRPRRLRLDEASRLVYRIVPLHDFSRPGAPVSGYRVERRGDGVDELGLSVGSVVVLGRFERAEDARAALVAVPAGSIDDETARVPRLAVAS